MGTAQADELALQHEAGQPGGLGRELQAPPGCPVERADLAEQGGEGAGAQALLQSPEPGRLVAGAGQDQPAGVESGGGQRRGIEVEPRRDPEDRPGPRRQDPRQQGQGEAERRAVVPLRPLAFDLVQPGQRQAAARQMGIERRRAQRQHRPPPGSADRPSLQSPHPGAQGRKARPAGGDSHGSVLCLLFMFCSYNENSVGVKNGR